MCGIAGIYNYGNKVKADSALLKQMTDVIAHRGPDDDGFYIKDTVGLGHRRLSIIDVSGGHQPIFNEDGTVAIVFNGEIYNYQKLAKLVEDRGHTLQTRSDTETIVHLYEEFGEKCVAMLSGMFAFAIWDSRNNSMLLARDRLGKKPLYYSDFNGKFSFGSEVKCLIQDPEIPREIDVQALADYFSFLAIPAPKSIFKHVRKVRPAHYLVVTAQGIREQEYWDLNFNQVEDRSEEEWAENLISSLRDAVGSRLMSEVPLGAFLSGGVDSSAVVAMMTKITGRPVVTASIGFTSEKYSEAAAAKKFAESVNADHHERIVAPDTVSIVEKLAWHYDEPFADSSAVPTYYVSQVAREFVTVALSGDGGDENFAGYRRYRFDAAENRVRQMIPASLRKMAFGTAGGLYPQADWLPRPLRAKATLTNISLDHSQAYFNSVYGLMSKESAGLFDGDLTASLQGYSPFDLFRHFYDRAPADDPLSRIQYVDIKTYLVDDILTKVDRASMAVSLEVRCPLLDHEFMENAARIPSSLKLKNGVGKYIFKEAIKKIVPEEILNRPKMGFSIPLAEWLRGDLKDLAHSLLFDQHDSLLNQQSVRKMWDRHQSGLRDLGSPLWTILMFRLWQRKFAA